jgi:hypothetical protein
MAIGEAKGNRANQCSAINYLFIIAIMALAINLLDRAPPKDTLRGFYYYAVKPFFTKAPGMPQERVHHFST